VKLSHVKHIKDCLLHWASNAAPEVMLVNTMIMPVVVKMIAHQEMPLGDDLNTLCMFGEGVSSLIKFDHHRYPDLAQSGKLSQELTGLLTVSVKLVRAGLVGDGLQSKCIPGPWPTLESETYSPFEEMVRTGTWAPGIPLKWTMPTFHQDHLAHQARARSQKAKEDLNKQLTEMGTACTKKQPRHRALTPGMFTIFCAGCGICVLFEMMDHAECPLTPFKIFAHRDWTWKGGSDGQ
jgi:hypothetical protein